MHANESEPARRNRIERPAQVGRLQVRLVPPLKKAGQKLVLLLAEQLIVQPHAQAYHLLVI